jgi:pentatricopeptide repeat protein
MVDTCGRAGEWRKAMQWFEDMEAASLVPDLVAFNALINACAKGQQWDRARGVFQVSAVSVLKPRLRKQKMRSCALPPCRRWRRTMWSLMW